MKRTLILSLIVFGASIVHAQNSCSTALPITTGTYTVDAVNGPQIPVPICANTGVGATHTEWYSYAPTQDYSLTITTDLPQNAGGDTRFHVYKGACGSLTCVGSGEDEGTGELSTATVQVLTGFTYRIAFDDRWSAAGFDFQLSEGPPVVTEFNFVQEPLPGGLGSMCVVDMDGDRLDDIVETDQTHVRIAHQQANGSFSTINITTPAATNPASWSIAAGDLDNNGYTDLMYGGGGGASFMLAGPGGTSFTAINPPEYIFCQRTNMVDINADGNLDAFSCHDVDANVAFLNDGNGGFVFEQGGYGETCGNYGSLWLDYDNDGDIDLFLSKCGCDPVDKLMRNNGDGTFTDVAPALGLNDNHGSWSTACGDYDNDGDMDLLGGESGSSHMVLWRNNLGTFTNVTAGSGIDPQSGGSVEWCTHDFNNDGHLDILGYGPTGLLMGNGDLTFYPSTAIPVGNGAVGDLNNDGFLDVLSYNGMLMNTGNSNRYLRVNLIGTQSNLNGIGARVQVTSALGTQMREIRSGDGFRFMSSLMAHFGLGSDTQVDHIAVTWPSGVVDVIEDPQINTTIDIVEGSGSVDIAEKPVAELSLSPNPVADVLNLSVGNGLVRGTVRVLDVAGKEVMIAQLTNGRLIVGALKPGIYSVHLLVGEKSVVGKFSKL
jgi:ASPIC and UnbV/FG-GAP-like repeat